MSADDPHNRPIDECLRYLNGLPEYRRVLEELNRQALDLVDDYTMADSEFLAGRGVGACKGLREAIAFLSAV